MNFHLHDNNLTDHTSATISATHSTSALANFQRAGKIIGPSLSVTRHLVDHFFSIFICVAVGIKPLTLFANRDPKFQPLKCNYHQYMIPIFGTSSHVYVKYMQQMDCTVYETRNSPLLRYDQGYSFQNIYILLDS